VKLFTVELMKNLYPRKMPTPAACVTRRYESVVRSEAAELLDRAGGFDCAEEREAEAGTLDSFSEEYSLLNL